MRSESENFYGSMPLLLKVEFHAFSKEIKKQVREEQDGICAMCGGMGRLECHHIVPQNALKGIGITGRDNRANAVGLCNGKTGKGIGSKDDCHEVADSKAITERQFFYNGRFVKLDELPSDLYTQGAYNRMPKRRRRRYQHK